MNTAHGRAAPSSRPIHLILIAWSLIRVLAVALGVANVDFVLSASTKPAITGLLIALVVVESVCVVVHLLRTRRLPGTRLLAVDLATSLSVALTPLIAPAITVELRAAWYFAFIVTSAGLLAISAIPATWLAAGTVGLSGAYAWGRMLDGAWPDIGAAISGSATTTVLVALTCLGGRYMITLSHRLDDAVQTNAWLAASAAVANERAAQRVFLHDTAGLLSMIANTSDPELTRILRDRARSTSRELRDFIYRERKLEPEATTSLQPILAAVVAEFRDLQIECNLLRVQNVRLDSDTAAVVTSAVRTLLDNVRAHAGTSNVTLHASAEGGSWEITVRDDGIGFDVATTEKGFGLRDQVESQCALHAIATTISSHPGEGTAVTLRGAGYIAEPLSVPAAPDPARSHHERERIGRSDPGPRWTQLKSHQRQHHAHD